MSKNTIRYGLMGISEKLFNYIGDFKDYNTSIKAISDCFCMGDKNGNVVTKINAYDLLKNDSKRKLTWQKCVEKKYYKGLLGEAFLIGRFLDLYTIWSKRYWKWSLIGGKFGDLYNKIDKCIYSNRSVIIEGETGTGKDLIAKVIHYNSERKDKPFIPINCSAIPDNIAESELFGTIPNYPGFHNKNGMIGKFEQANGGTLFLDEIGDMKPNIQAKILRAVEEKEIVKVGGTRPIKLDIRIISATNKDIEDLIRKGEFRLDLYQRLRTGYKITTLKLRDCIDEIPLLLYYYIKSYEMENNTIIESIPRGFLIFLYHNEYNGNYRDFKRLVDEYCDTFSIGNINTYLKEIENQINVIFPPETIKPRRRNEWNKFILETIITNELLDVFVNGLQLDFIKKYFQEDKINDLEEEITKSNSILDKNVKPLKKFKSALNYIDKMVEENLELKEVEKLYLMRFISKNKWESLNEIASALGIPDQRTLRKKIKLYDLEPLGYAFIKKFK